MRRLAIVVLVSCVGCSTAPLAGFLDTVAPAKVRLDPVTSGPVVDPFFSPTPGRSELPPTNVPPVTIPAGSASNTFAPPAFAPPAAPPPVSVDPPSPWTPRTPPLPNT